MNECIKPLFAYDTGCKTKTGKTQYFIDLGKCTNNCELIVRPYMHISVDPSPEVCHYNKHGELVLHRYVKLPCGKCPACLVAKSEEWSTRLYLESLAHQSYYFVTLTYAPEYYSVLRDFKRDFQLFMKRLRKKLGAQKLRFFAFFEHGEILGRGHFHAILFFDEPVQDTLTFLKTNGKVIYYTSALIQSCWFYGFDTTEISDDSTRVFNYVSKYCVKKMNVEDVHEFHLESKGLGSNYLHEVDSGCLLVTNGMKVYKKKIPSYLYRKLEEINPEMYNHIKSYKRQWVDHQYLTSPEIDDYPLESDQLRENLTKFLSTHLNIYKKAL